MKKASKNKKIFIIAIEVIVIVLTFIGVTLATSNIINDNIKVGLKAGDFNVDFKGKSNISFNNLEPISDKLININTKDNVVRVEFSVKSIKQDKDYNIVSLETFQLSLLFFFFIIAPQNLNTLYVYYM